MGGARWKKKALGVTFAAQMSERECPQTLLPMPRSLLPVASSIVRIWDCSAASRRSAVIIAVENRKVCSSLPARYAHTRAVAESNETERPLNHPGWAQRSGGRLSPSTTAVARSVSGTRGAKTQGPFNFAARRPPKSPTCGGAVPNLHNVQRTRQKASGLSWN